MALQSIMRATGQADAVTVAAGGSVRVVSTAYRTRFSPNQVALFIGFCALAIRLGYSFANGGLHSAIEYDDGAHYGSALLLLHGKLPYRDFVFLQPPGITLLLTPTAALGRLTTPFAGFVAARLITAMVAGVNAALIVRLVSRSSSTSRGLLAGSLYALSVPSVVAGSTALIEPWLSLLMLLSLQQLLERGSSERAGFYAGIFAGLAATIKVWAGVFALLLIIGLLFERRPKAARQVFGGCVGAGTVVLLPFLLLSPRSFLTDILTTQANRPAAGIQGITARWESVSGLSGLVHGSQLTLTISVALIALVTVSLFRAFHSSRLGRFLALQVAGALLIFSLARPFYTHYGEYLVVFLAPCVALGAPSGYRLWFQKARSLSLGLILLPVLLVLLSGWVSIQAVELSQRAVQSSVDTAQLSLALGDAHCVVSDQMTLAILGNASTTCAWLDPRGTALTMLKGRQPRDFYPRGFQKLAPWQALWRQRLSHADAAILTSAPCRHLEWSPSLCAYVTSSFRFVSTVGTAGPGQLQVQVWKRK